MAFQHHGRQAVHRPFAQEGNLLNVSLVHATPPPSSNVPPVQTTVEPQTWVLFSPTAAEDVTTTCGSASLSSLVESQQTPGRSRISDLGSVNSLGRQNYDPSRPESIASHRRVLAPSVLSSSLSGAVIDNGEHFFDEDGEDDAELDSLDSHLADFRAIVSSKQITTQKPERQGGYATQQAAAAAATASAVHLPAHDGLGSFQLGWTGEMGTSLQEHLYAFERFNPRRVVDSRRRESLDLAQLQIQKEYLEEVERIKRIEAWQLDQSNYFLGEIQRETRRRRDSLATRGIGGGGATAIPVTGQDGVHGEVGGEWHEQEEEEAVHGTKEEAAETSSADKDDAEGLWSRLTRKFMLEVMGIDDHVLSIFFGESLANADDQNEDASLLSAARRAGIYLGVLGSKEAEQRQEMKMDERNMASGDATSTWQYRMLQNIAKELGLLVHRHIATAHPGAFSTFQQVQQSPLPYAGLPMIPESTTTTRLEPMVANNVSLKVGVMEDLDDVTRTAATTFFEPTIQHMKQPQQTELPHDCYGEHSSSLPSPTNVTAPTFTQDEWEQDLDIKLVFRYLRSRFLSGGATAASHGHHQPHHPYGHYGKHNSGASSTMSTQDVAAKVARVRQHHPLIGRNAARQAGDRRPMLASRNMAGLAAQSAVFGHRHPHGTSASWANQSTRRSARRASVSSRQSSRHYWDIGGSVGTGSVIASVGPMGSWGDV